MAWHGMAWHGMAWHGMAWHGPTLRCRRATVLGVPKGGGRKATFATGERAIGLRPAGLLPLLREVIELLFQEGLLKVPSSGKEVSYPYQFQKYALRTPPLSSVATTTETHPSLLRAAARPYRRLPVTPAGGPCGA
jgi:hypothetical protein